MPTFLAALILAIALVVDIAVDSPVRRMVNAVRRRFC